MPEQDNLPTTYLSPEQEKEIQVDLRNALDTAQNLAVVDTESYDKANNVLTWINSRQKGIENFRLGIVKPFKDHLKKIDAFFNGYSAKFDAPKEEITKKIVTYREKEAKLARKKHQDLPAKTTQHDLGAVTYVKTSDWEVSNPDLVPEEFWTIDKVKLGARVREHNKSLVVGKVYKDLIPGVTIRVTERPSIREDV